MHGGECFALLQIRAVGEDPFLMFLDADPEGRNYAPSGNDHAPTCHRPTMEGKSQNQFWKNIREPAVPLRPGAPQRTPAHGSEQVLRRSEEHTSELQSQ